MQEISMQSSVSLGVCRGPQFREAPFSGHGIIIPDKKVCQNTGFAHTTSRTIESMPIQPLHLDTNPRDIVGS